MFKSLLAVVRYYTGADPYYYTVDNRPLEDLKDRDDQLADELDRRTKVIDISGSVTPVTNTLPAGWSVVRTGDGVYEITHTLASTSFIVTGSILGATAGVVTTTSQTSSLIIVKTVNMAGTATDFRFQCLVTGY